MTQQHIMLDIETLDTTARAVVISIGAVAFTLEGGARSFPFYRTVAYDDQIAKGRRISADTLKFWNAQSEEARGAAFGGVRVHTEFCLRELTEFVSTRFSEPLIWAYPAAFDLAIMEDLYTDFGMDIPWSHRAKRCARTLYSLAGNPSFKHEGHVLPHHPVSDCQVQITQMRVALEHIKYHGVNIA